MHLIIPFSSSHIVDECNKLQSCNNNHNTSNFDYNITVSCNGADTCSSSCQQVQLFVKVMGDVFMDQQYVSVKMVISGKIDQNFDRNFCLYINKQQNYNYNYNTVYGLISQQKCYNSSYKTLESVKQLKRYSITKTIMYMSVSHTCLRC